MDSEIPKALLRRSVLDYRKLLAEASYQERNEHLLENIKVFLGGASSGRIHTFLSISKNKEPDLSPIFPWMRSKGFHLAVSKTNFKDQSLSHYILETSTTLSINKMGIPEPTSGPFADFDQIDVIFVPLAACDRSGIRIGYGGGYYDRLLQETNAVKIGLSLSSPLDRIIQRDSWDVPLNYLITPFKTYNYG